jgi:hypothetical protein
MALSKPTDFEDFVATLPLQNAFKATGCQGSSTWIVPKKPMYALNGIPLGKVSFCEACSKGFPEDQIVKHTPSELIERPLSCDMQKMRSSKTDTYIDSYAMPHNSRKLRSSDKTFTIGVNTNYKNQDFRPVIFPPDTSTDVPIGLPTLASYEVVINKGLNCPEGTTHIQIQSSINGVENFQDPNTYYSSQKIINTIDGKTQTLAFFPSKKGVDSIECPAEPIVWKIIVTFFKECDRCSSCRKVATDSYHGLMYCKICHEQKLSEEEAKQRIAEEEHVVYRGGITRGGSITRGGRASKSISLPKKVDYSQYRSISKGGDPSQYRSCSKGGATPGYTLKSSNVCKQEKIRRTNKIFVPLGKSEEQEIIFTCSDDEATRECITEKLLEKYRKYIKALSIEQEIKRLQEEYKTLYVNIDDMDSLYSE